MMLSHLCRRVITTPLWSPSRWLPTQRSLTRWCSHSDVISVLEKRGLVETMSAGEELKDLVKQGPVRLYCGFDPTADSLHLGNLLAIIVLTWFGRYGHEPYALIGGATGRVGDPSGKQNERPILSEQELQQNSTGIRKVLSDIFEQNTSKESSELKIMDNIEWFGEMKFLSFLRDVGKFARLGTMLSKESVKTRLTSESGMSFTEFSYQLLQGLQIGGSDQWGNITAGTDIIRRLWSSEETPLAVHGLTFPLLVDSEGKKFGKSESGAIWLSSEKLSPYKFYQHLYSTTDVDVIRFLKMLTFLSDSELAAIEDFMKQPDYVPNSAQERLAEEVTKFVHGEAGLKQAQAATQVLKPGADTELNAEMLMEVAGEAPNASLTRQEILDSFLTDVMVKVNMLESKGAVKRMIKNGGVRLNNKKVEDEKLKVSEKDLIDDKLILIAAGKKNKLLLTIK